MVNIYKHIEISTKSNIIVFEGENSMIYTTSMLKERYKGYSNILDKIKRDCDDNLLFRINRGIYEDNRNVDPFFLAPIILSPSYISFESALSYYGLIPERVYAITSASLKERKNKSFTNVFARYTYSDIPEDIFSYGQLMLRDGEYTLRIASKEKAICDSLYKWRKVKSIKQLKILLFIDKRIDEEEFAKCDMNELLELASLYRCSNLNLLIQLIRKEYQHEWCA